MGKVRVKSFGLPEEEEKQKRKIKQKHEARLDKHGQTKKTVKAPGLKGGERVVAVGPSEEEIAQVVEETRPEEKKEEPSFAKASKGKKEKFAKKKIRSKRYQTSVQVLDKSKIYPLSEALELLAKFQKAKFDETIELHINTVKNGISATLTLPHGTGKKTKVAIVSDKLIEDVEKGKIDFYILISTPDMMPKLAKVAKILGPRGLMPNSKNGTITTKPEEVVKKFEAGQIFFKTEAKAPIIHVSVGKFSFGDKKLKENIDTILGAVKPENIQKMVLKSTMSPGIKIKL